MKFTPIAGVVLIEVRLHAAAIHREPDTAEDTRTRPVQHLGPVPPAASNPSRAV